MLVRVSSLTAPDDAAFRLQEAFLRDMFEAVPQGVRGGTSGALTPKRELAGCSRSDQGSVAAGSGTPGATSGSTPQASGRCRFSVATPTRNALAKLLRCVGSVRGQQGVPFEHLVQDAASADGTAQWLADQPDLCWRSEADAGMYDAIARACSRRRGVPELAQCRRAVPACTLQRIADYFDSHPEVDVVFGDYVVAGPDGRVIALRREIPFRPLHRGEQLPVLRLVQPVLPGDARPEQGWAGVRSGPGVTPPTATSMLSLAARGARIAHLPGYLALFGLDGTNLSGHGAHGRGGRVRPPAPRRAWSAPSCARGAGHAPRRAVGARGLPP
jgi:hypothetical protein